jgi:hypothetical protein
MIRGHIMRKRALPFHFSIIDWFGRGAEGITEFGRGAGAEAAGLGFTKRTLSDNTL